MKGCVPVVGTKSDEPMSLNGFATLVLNASAGKAGVLVCVGIVGGVKM